MFRKYAGMILFRRWKQRFIWILVSGTFMWLIMHLGILFNYQDPPKLKGIGVACRKKMVNFANG